MVENLPYQGGGGMIDEVKKDEITFADAHTKFEAGTMQTAEVVAFAESLNFIENLGIKNISSHENKVLQYGLEILKKNNSIKIIGDPKVRGSVLCFTLKDIHPHDIATILDDDGVAIEQDIIVVKYYTISLEYLQQLELQSEYIMTKTIWINCLKQLKLSESI